MHVHIAEDEAERVGVARRPLDAVVRGEEQLVFKTLLGIRDRRLEKSRVHFHGVEAPLVIMHVAHGDRARIGPEHPHHHMVPRKVHAEHRERIAVPGLDQAVEISVVDGFSGRVHKGCDGFFSSGSKWRG